MMTTTSETTTSSPVPQGKGVVTEVLRHRRLLYLMARQDLKNDYGRYRFGILWTLGEPLLMAVLMYTVFHFVFRTTRGIALDPFMVYLFTGMVPFAWLSSSINKGPTTFRRYQTFLTFSKLPIMFWPLRSVHVGFMEVLLSIPVVVVLTVAFGAFFSWGVILVPLGFLAQWFLCLGLSMIFSAMGATFPDTRKLTGLLVRILFWTSPILWQNKNFGPIEPFLYLNPFHGILDMYRAAIWPQEVLNKPINYLVSSVVIVVVFSVGMAMMRTRVREVRRLG
jgi:ABC-2 type transport system permease protein